MFGNEAGKNETKFNEMLEGKDYIRYETSLGSGMLWVFVEDQRDGKAIGGTCTDPRSRYHREGDLPLTEEGVEEMFGWLCEEFPKLADPNRSPYNHEIPPEFGVEEAE
jgi:hypothetical protein